MILQKRDSLMQVLRILRPLLALSPTILSRSGQSDYPEGVVVDRLSWAV
jgi:hypothetical protein